MRFIRTHEEAARDKRRAVDEADAAGLIADSIEVRLSLIDRVRTGEITLQQAEDELDRINRIAKKEGKRTRAQVWRES